MVLKRKPSPDIVALPLPFFRMCAYLRWARGSSMSIGWGDSVGKRPGPRTISFFLQIRFTGLFFRNFNLLAFGLRN